MAASSVFLLPSLSSFASSSSSAAVTLRSTTSSSSLYFPPPPLLSIHKNTQIPGATMRFSCGRRGMRIPRMSVSAVAIMLQPSKVAPQENRVFIKLEQLPQKSAGGVLLPKSAVKFERYLVGEVISVGEGVDNVEAGKKVLFSDINAYEVDMGTDDKFCFCQAEELLAVVE